MKSVSLMSSVAPPPPNRVEAERKQSGGMLELDMSDVVIVVIPKKTKIRVPLLHKKSGTKRHPITITITIGGRTLSFIPDANNLFFFPCR